MRVELEASLGYVMKPSQKKKKKKKRKEEGRKDRRKERRNKTKTPGFNLHCKKKKRKENQCTDMLITPCSYTPGKSLSFGLNLKA
jgi:hypothetical protein